MIIKRLFKLLVYLSVVIGSSASFAGAYDDYFRAIEVDDAGAVRRLLERGFDPNAVDERGQVGLFLAFRGGSRKVVPVLLSSPQIDIDRVNAADETPLMMAALRGELPWAQLLAERGARVNRKGWTPLHYAASGPGVAVVRYLLERGAELEARSPNGTTPLMMAARYGAEESALLLLERGADRARRNDLGLDAAEFARLAGRESLALKLKGEAR